MSPPETYPDSGGEENRGGLQEFRNKALQGSSGHAPVEFEQSESTYLEDSCSQCISDMTFIKRNFVQSVKF